MPANIFGDITIAAAGSIAPEDAGRLNEGMLMVREDNGQIYRVRSIQYTGERMLIFLDQDPGTGHTFRFMPIDPLIGRSPCLAVYTKSFPL